jgi:hypothetical protein
MHHASSYVIVDVNHSLGDANQITDMAHISCKYNTCSGHQVTKIKKNNGSNAQAAQALN